MTLRHEHLRRVAEFCDGRLDAREHAVAVAHLDECASCRAVVEDFRFAAGLVRQLTVERAPDSVWRSIESTLAAPAAVPQARPSSDGWQRQPTLSWLMPRLALVAVLATVAIGMALVYMRAGAPREPERGWSVTELTGVRPFDRLVVGSALETDAASRLRLTVGDIGTVDIDPNTRVRLVAAEANQQRLALDRGVISATISAPPRIFVVDTEASTVVDLGCQYTMRVEEDGTGSATVTAGWISLEWGGRESLVPAGASCRTRRGVGPGTPSFDDAPAALKTAVESFDFERGGPGAIDAALAAARVRDTLTLWHLLSRVDPAVRERVFDRIAALTPLPGGVTREKALQLDPDTLKRWREELAWTW